MKNGKFIKTTIGLNATRQDRPPAMTRIEFYDIDGYVACIPVSGHNLSEKPGRVLISRADFDALPRDPYDDVVFARAAFSLCGYEI